MRTRKYSLIIGLFFLILGFQNCSPMMFSPDEARLGKVAALGDDETNTVPIPGDEDLVPPPGDGDNELPPVAGSDEGGTTAEAPGDGEEVDPDADNDVPPAQGAMGFICILDGPGKSVRLGLINNSLGAHGKTPGVVCMSEYACNNLVSQKFAVKGPEKRGFCPNKNPHVIPLSDADLKGRLGI